jgi:hypothetical protein
MSGSFFKIAAASSMLAFGVAAWACCATSSTFDGAAIAGPLMVIAGWGAFGFALELVAQARTRLWAAVAPVPQPAA